MACENCTSKSEKPQTVPYIVYESAVGRMGRIIKRLVIAIITAIVLIFLTTAAWLLYLSGYDVEGYTEIEAEQDGEGINIVGGGNVTYGAESENPQDSAES